MIAPLVVETFGVLPMEDRLSGRPLLRMGTEDAERPLMTERQGLVPVAIKAERMGDPITGTATKPILSDTRPEYTLETPMPRFPPVVVAPEAQTQGTVTLGVGTSGGGAGAAQGQAPAVGTVVVPSPTQAPVPLPTGSQPATGGFFPQVAGWMQQELIRGVANKWLVAAAGALVISILLARGRD